MSNINQRNRVLVNFLNEDEVNCGEIVPIYFNNRLESYARLIESAGDRLSFIKQKDPDEIVYVNQRWLIEWVHPDLVAEELNRTMYWTQRTLAGRRTHRQITFQAKESWDEYIKEYGNIKHRRYYQRPSLLDDDNVLF